MFLYLSLSIRIYPYLSVSIRIYLYPSVSIRIYPYLSVSTRIYPCLSVSIQHVHLVFWSGRGCLDFHGGLLDIFCRRPNEVSLLRITNSSRNAITPIQAKVYRSWIEALFPSSAQPEWTSGMNSRQKRHIPIFPFSYMYTILWMLTRHAYSLHEQDIVCMWMRPTRLLSSTFEILRVSTTHMRHFFWLKKDPCEDTNAISYVCQRDSRLSSIHIRNYMFVNETYLPALTYIRNLVYVNDIQVVLYFPKADPFEDLYTLSYVYQRDPHVVYIYETFHVCQWGASVFSYIQTILYVYQRDARFFQSRPSRRYISTILCISMRPTCLVHI